MKKCLPDSLVFLAQSFVVFLWYLRILFPLWHPSMSLRSFGPQFSLCDSNSTINDNLSLNLISKCWKCYLRGLHSYNCFRAGYPPPHPPPPAARTLIMRSRSRICHFRNVPVLIFKGLETVSLLILI